VPLLFALEDCRLEEAFRRGYIAGLVFFAMTIWWIYHVTLPGTMGLIAFLALYFGVGALVIVMVNSLMPDAANSENQFGAGAAIRNVFVPPLLRGGDAGMAARKIVVRRLPLELHRCYPVAGGPLIQFASATGIYGVSALVCFVNVVLYFTIRRFVVQYERARSGGD